MRFSVTMCESKVRHPNIQLGINRHRNESKTDLDIRAIRPCQTSILNMIDHIYLDAHTVMTLLCAWAALQACRLKF